MAQLNDIIDELNTIATAFTGINTFVFDEIGEINSDRLKSYPALLVDSRNLGINVTKLDRNNLPDKIDYSLKLFFLDTYFVSEQKTTDRQTKFAAMETIANQYLAEIQRRTLADSTKGFFIKSREVSNGFVLDKLHNDELCQLVYDVVIRADNDCSLGTFAY